MISRYRRTLLLVAGIAAIAFIAYETRELVEHPGARNEHRSAGAIDRAGSSLVASPDAIRSDSTINPSAINKSVSAASTSPGLQLADISKKLSAREIVEFSRRTDDVSLREYAMWGGALMCRSHRFATRDVKHFQAFGVSNAARTERVLQQLMEESRVAAARVRERCADFDESDELQSALVDEAERERFPLVLATAAMGELSRENANEAAALREARSRIATLLAGSQPEAMTSALFSMMISTQRRRYAAEFPNTPIEDWLLGPVTAAYQIAACRGPGERCGPGSLERDIVCARYGECRAPDLESSYRRLFDLYGIPFEDTDRLANKLQRAIAARDTVTLLP